MFNSAREVFTSTRRDNTAALQPVLKWTLGATNSIQNNADLAIQKNDINEGVCVDPVQKLLVERAVTIIHRHGRSLQRMSLPRRVSHREMVNPVVSVMGRVCLR